MSIQSIKIKNLLSFGSIELKNIEEINAIVGMNNVGKSNFLSLVKFFYEKMASDRILAPELNSNYSPIGEITIKYDLSRIKKIVMSGRNKSKFFNIIYSSIIKDSTVSFFSMFSSSFKNESKSFELTLIVNSNGSSYWLEKDKQRIEIIKYLFPFFHIDSRHIDLHDWDKIWDLVASVKSLNVEKLDMDEFKEYIDSKLSNKGSIFSDYINLIENSVTIEKYSHKEKVLSLLKAAVKGSVFSSEGRNTQYQSDGTNSFNYIDSTLKLLMLITRSEYISPFVFVDEPEVGLHPKKCERLVNNVYETYKKFGFKDGERRATQFPKIIFSTHSSSVVKEIIKNFQENHQVIHFSLDENNRTRLQIMNSIYKENNFLSIFSDNEARLFFSKFILFVEGETELEIFGNFKLQNKFKLLKEIEIYKCSNNKIAEGINPSYSNTSIPYLFLYDADKFYEFEMQVSQKLKIKFKNATKLVGIKSDKIAQDLKYYKRGFSNEHKKMFSRLEQISSFLGNELETDDTGLFFKSNSPFYVFRIQAREYLKNKRVSVFNDTIEGALINESSKEIFFKWLLSHYNVDVSHLRGVTTQLRNSSTVVINDKVLLTSIKLMFEGKSDTQFKKKKPYKQVADLDFYINGQADWPPVSKTSGWVTYFLDFAIDEIEKESLLSQDHNFYELFNSYFPELYAILNRLYPDRLQRSLSQ
ncbi:AAA family ATPase [Photobacterium carnosum]|uniref:retron Eco8 family effector endonuclease n=1 Tax=Photobacterium carnosum TaxID=2023717 RepID=UPI001E32D026|nr:retron Eco8 family effector endonuclease [Photobacterium carnosum]MCD9540599.1 AAA family ATPase [Photobacterium carnosum]